jgi:hypothetical protein
VKLTIYVYYVSLVTPFVLSKRGRKVGNRIEVSEEFLLSVGHTMKSYEALSRSGKFAARNREKQKESTASWARKNPERRRQINRDYFLKRDYGLTQGDYDALLKEQGGCCEICGADKPTGRWKVFAVDHCHTTGDVRGLLCNECNRGMGLLGDSEERLRQAANYLQSHKKRTDEERKK